MVAEEVRKYVCPLSVHWRELFFVQIIQVTKKIHFLESTAGSTTAHLAGAVAVAADVDLGQLGDGDDRDSGVKGDAEGRVKGPFN